MDSNLDIVNKFLERRLQQTDIKGILNLLSETDREGFLAKISEVLAKLTALLEVSRKVSDTLELDKLLERMISITTEAINTDRGTLFLNDKNTDELFSRVAQGNLVNEIRFPNHMGIAGSVFKSGEAAVINDAYSDPRFNPEIDKKTGYTTRSILCMPVKSKDKKTIGDIQALNKKGGPFNRIDENCLRAFSAQASIAIENANLFDDVINMKNYNEGIAYYRRQQWEKASEKFKKAVSLYEKDGLSKIYIERCKYFLQNPPEKTWDGVWTMSDK